MQNFDDLGGEDGTPHSQSSSANALRARIFIFSRGASTPCTITGISGSDIEAACLYEGTPGVEAVIFTEGFGALTGVILSWKKNILRFRYSTGDSRNVWLPRDLTHFISSDGKLRPPRRADPMPFPSRGSFIRVSGENVNFELIRISAYGISVNSPVQPPVGEFLNFGIFFTRVVRWHEGGFKARFLDNM